MVVGCCVWGGGGSRTLAASCTQSSILELQHTHTRACEWVGRKFTMVTRMEVHLHASDMHIDKPVAGSASQELIGYEPFTMPFHTDLQGQCSVRRGESGQGCCLMIQCPITLSAPFSAPFSAHHTQSPIQCPIAMEHRGALNMCDMSTSGRCRAGRGQSRVYIAGGCPC